MIRISGRTIDPRNIITQYPSDSLEVKILNIMSTSEEIYSYNSIEQLKFELNLRVNIINTSLELYRSNFAFRVFRKSYCNEDFWERTNQGGFLLKRDAKPSEAINDIFTSSHKYGTECATAMVIIFYKAVSNVFPVELFDRLFSRIHLMNWHYLDNDLDIGYYANEASYLPGDCMYFKNPDVNPLTPEWQGENAIDLSNGHYYGHGIGIKTGEEIIEILNSRRKSDATKSAYLMDSATRINFKYLYDVFSRAVN